MRMNMMVTILISIIFAFQVANGAPKATPPPPAAPAHVPGLLNLNISEAIKKALAYSPDVQKAEGTLKQAEDNLDKAKGSFFPTINAIAQANAHQNSSTSSTATLPTTISSNTGDLYQVGLTMTQPLYAGGGLIAGLNLYKTNVDLGRQQYFQAKQSLLNSLLGAYFSLVQAEMNKEAAESNRDIIKAYLDITTHYAHIGRSRIMDKDQADANFMSSLIDVEQTQNLLTAAMANVNRYIGEDKSHPVKSDYRVDVSSIGNLSQEDALATAVQNNPTLISDKLNVEVVDYNRDVDLATDNPTASFTATGGYQSPDTPNLWNSNSQYYTVGVNLTIPLFSGLTSISKKHYYADGSYAAQKQLQSDRDSTRSQIETAISNIKSMQAQLDLGLKAVKLARVALDLANKGYREGTAASTDVITIQTTRYNAEKQLISSQYNYLTALLSLRLQMGIDLEKAYGH